MVRVDDESDPVLMTAVLINRYLVTCENEVKLVRPSLPYHSLITQVTEKRVLSLVTHDLDPSSVTHTHTLRPPGRKMLLSN